MNVLPAAFGQRTGSRVRNAIIDKHVRVPAGFSIGHDPDLDRARGFTVTDGGITVIAKGEDLDRLSQPRV